MKYLVNTIEGGHLALAADALGLHWVALGDTEQELVAAVTKQFGAHSPMRVGPEDPSRSWLDTTLLNGFIKIANYIHGRTDDLLDLRLHMQGSTYQRRVWRQLMGIPRGLTLTYTQIATSLGSHARAVGSACAANDLAVVIPCHRVVPKQQGDFKPGEYRWGPKWKQRLLMMEGAIPSPDPS